ncbi:MAG: type I restriction endonuclease subunit R [Parcubacteria group bacterium]|jgi:type I restriction enzyme R subunit
MRFNEQHTIENHIIKYFKNDLKYEYVKPDEFAELREFENEYLITPLFQESIKKLNGIEDDNLVQLLVKELKKIDNNEEFLNALRNGINRKDPKTNKKTDYKVIDFEKPENNRFIITNQFYFEGNTENIRPDMMIFVNGIPIADIEAKSPTASASVSWENAVGQIKRYENVAPRLFIPNCFNVATDGTEAGTRYGATNSPIQYFFQWKDEENAKKFAGNLELALWNLFDKSQLLDILKNFIVFEKEEGKTIKKMCRYQQYRAANRILKRVEDGKKRKGLIWHTQGSGKSLTMFFTAWKLRYAEGLKNPKVFILVDRIDLDDQIHDTFTACGGKNIIRITSRKKLEEKITNDERGIFITTIQKFAELGSGVQNENSNLIVLADEAHRTNEGISGINARFSFRDAFWFGFTGTPIDKTTLNTHRNFGEEGERYLDYYSIQQAIDDGATLPVYFETRLSKYFINEEELDKQFEELTAGLSEKQKEELKKTHGKKEAIVKLVKRISAIATDIAEHYKIYVLPNNFKAQVVCYDKEACLMYKTALDKIIPENWSKIIYSTGDPNIEDSEIKKHYTAKDQRRNIIEAFKDKNQEPKILIVCDMLLTGFDAPIEQVMYLDKPLFDHSLLQAIARTNRVYPNKGCGKIIDYYGITRSLEKALDFDESILDSALIDIARLKEQFKQKLKECLDLFGGINIEDPSLENLRRALRIFADNKDKQKLFENLFAKIKLMFEIISPDPFLKPYIRQVEWLTSFSLAYNREFKAPTEEEIRMEEYGEKIKQLIQEKVDLQGIIRTFKEISITDLYQMKQLEKMEAEDKARALEKMLKSEISINIETNPTYHKFSERLVKIKRDFEDNQIDLDKKIQELWKLREDLVDKRDEAKKLGYNLQEYGVYVISQEFLENIETNKEIKPFIQDMVEAITETLDKGWQESSKREEFVKEIKRKLTKLILKDYKDKIQVRDFPKYINRIIDVVQRKF